MKRIVILVCLSLVSSVAFAQGQEKKEEVTIPSDVIDAFSMLYPSVKDVNWDLVEKDFEANFAQNERALSVRFDQHGNLILITKKLEHTELPVPVIAKLKTEYADWSVQKALSVDIMGTTSYQVELEKAGETINLTCNQHGDILKILSQESRK